jgi:DNA (cytosine-5)-methyltransferase 1
MSRIPNHYSAALSELDLRMVRAVPPGGNWKDIPPSVPSKRLEQIRESYERGEGSRSTYYGRLQADAPAYTINTYFNRPGNGCHIHYDYDGGQHRLLSQREAARLQSFPDAFEFCGGRASVNKQIGNAVPPLLAYQVARGLGEPSQFVDLFSGAGGLSLGFAWAGWHPVVANDHDADALATYSRNVHPCVAPGDIRNPNVFDRVVQLTRQQRSDERLFLLGGPPCQGFSTAGHRRSMDDSRNRLFEQYKAALTVLEPDGFVFENVPGLLNMDRGAVFRMIVGDLESVGYTTEWWALKTESYGIPQRRTRVLIVGRRSSATQFTAPAPITGYYREPTLLEEYPRVPGAREALSDLPPLLPGQDGSDMDYASAPSNGYQEFIRGGRTPQQYVDALSRSR